MDDTSAKLTKKSHTQIMYIKYQPGVYDTNTIDFQAEHGRMRSPETTISILFGNIRSTGTF